MSGRHQFCTHLAIERGEPVEGTGAFGGRILLLRWPRAKWREPRSAAPGLSPAVATARDYLAAKGDWCCMVDGFDSDTPDIIVYPGNIRVEGDDLTIAAAIRDYADGKMPDGVPEPRTVILCCVDSRTDACCARMGFPTYKAIAAAADPAKFLVLMSCHLGGCRFASSIMVPQRNERYGRVNAEDAEGFVAAVAAGEVYLPRFKGRWDLDEPAQVAELAARRWAAKSGRDPGAIALSAGEVEGANALHLGATVAGTELSIRLEARDFLMHGGCDVLNDGEPAELYSRWLVRDVVAST